MGAPPGSRHPYKSRADPPAGGGSNDHPTATTSPHLPPPPFLPNDDRLPLLLLATAPPALSSALWPAPVAPHPAAVAAAAAAAAAAARTQPVEARRPLSTPRIRKDTPRREVPPQREWFADDSAAAADGSRGKEMRALPH